MEITTNKDNFPVPEKVGQMGETERWSSLITGGSLVLLGLKQGSLRGALMALAGGGLVYHGTAGQKGIKDQITDSNESGSIKVEKTVTIFNKSPEELYQVWRNFENLPNFMKYLKSVQVIDGTRSHWVADAPLDQSVEWDAEMIQDRPNELIAWSSVEGADVENSGFVRFQKGPQGRGTEVKVVMEYNPPGGVIGANLAKLFGKEPEQLIGASLRHFKMLMEAGEIATTEGQPSGRQGDK
ncbi:cyclase [Aphanothece hegewaldii CCALA 016]|uniref:Cyclase n=1 Tax=Aphanothece hegewaldii CCALA 016 TaxID=2107694 RepID=A0A2T1LZK0_9CHRO|nr:SRPBCC family protein [Aphanothece hegewaldii]PSF37800.1 cyclase [Aphanothece hegewaldii CCALA 016]